jgi:hypothetical protein
VAIFIENTVFAKSYSAQLNLSRKGASGGLKSPAAVTDKLASVVIALFPIELAGADCIRVPFVAQYVTYLTPVMTVLKYVW